VRTVSSSLAIPFAAYGLSAATIAKGAFALVEVRENKDLLAAEVWVGRAHPWYEEEVYVDFVSIIRNAAKRFDDLKAGGTRLAVPGVLVRRYPTIDHFTEEDDGCLIETFA